MLIILHEMCFIIPLIELLLHIHQNVTYMEDSAQFLVKLCQHDGRGIIVQNLEFGTVYKYFCI